MNEIKTDCAFISLDIHLIDSYSPQTALSMASYQVARREAKGKQGKDDGNHTEILSC